MQSATLNLASENRSMLERATVGLGLLSSAAAVGITLIQIEQWLRVAGSAVFLLIGLLSLAREARKAFRK